MMTMLSEDMIVNNIHVPVVCWLMDMPGVKYVQLALSQVFVALYDQEVVNSFSSRQNHYQILRTRDHLVLAPGPGTTAW